MSEKSKNILLGVLIVGLVSMTVAYAALTTNLRIVGTANVAETKWDIHFANVAVVAADTTIAAADYNLGTLDNSQTATTGTLISGLTANLNKPGDKLTVGFDIANAGTIDATLTNFSKHITKDSGSASTADINDVVEYTIDCASGANLTNPNLNKRTDATHPTLAHCTLKVEYKENTGSAVQQSQTPGQDQTVNQSAKTFTFDADWSYAQR